MPADLPLKDRVRLALVRLPALIRTRLTLAGARRDPLQARLNPSSLSFPLDISHHH